MKILDKYLLKLFISTFTTVFVILFFIFILQTVWLFIAELAGKDLDFISVLKFLTFASPRVVPLVLPLSVLLASIMTFGNLAENYELAALKSSGVSLKRSMKYLSVFILFLSILAFVFANNVIPYAEFKFINMRKNIAQVKPAMAIAEGQFSEVGNYIIKVEKKSGDNGRFLDKVTIHKKLSYGNNQATIIKADKGELVSSEASNVLMMILKEGHYYEEIRPRKLEDRQKIPFAKSKFSRYTINIDLSKLQQDPLDKEQVTNTNTMLTIGELRYTLDSLEQNFKKDILSFGDNLNAKIIPAQAKGIATVANTAILNKNQAPNADLLQQFSQAERLQILNNALSVNESNRFSIESTKYDFESKVKNINGHWIAMYDKFVIAFSCILMFFIGAPLGAIIRKGGLGLPIVFAVLIFIVFHFINTFGKKLAQENGITPFLGCWMSTLLLLPLAVFLTKRATEDRGVSIELAWVDSLMQRFFPSENATPTEQENDLDHLPTENMQPSVAVIQPTKELVPLQPLDPVHKRRYLGLFLVPLVFYALTGFMMGFDSEKASTFSIVFGMLTLVSAGLVQWRWNQYLKKNQHDNEVHWILAVMLAVPFYILVLCFNLLLTHKIQKQFSHD